MNAAGEAWTAERPLWDRKPSWSDPRVPFAVTLAVYTALGVTALGFNRTPGQILLTVAAACLLDMALHYLFRGRRLLFPLSACISGLSLAILMNYAHGFWLPLAPVFFAIASKYLITFNGRHVFNPTLFAVTVCIVFGRGMFSAAPAYQWGGSLAMAAFIVTAALALFVFRIRRSALILSFLGLYFLQLAIRAYIVRHHVPPETLFLGAFTSASFYLFTFFMITDPQTSPSSTRGQIGMSLFIVAADLALHRFEALSTLFLAGFAWFAARFFWLHWRALRSGAPIRPRVAGLAGRAAALGAIYLCGFAVHSRMLARGAADGPGFRFREIPTARSGLDAGRSDILDRVDARIAHAAKWVLSAGDAAAIADFDGDGLQDLFLTYPLKDAAHRAALYRNRGGLRFERVPIPALEAMARSPETHGLPSGALWLDYDNDFDPDLLILAGFGRTLLLRNDSGAFTDVTRDSGIEEYTVSLAAAAFDFDRDARLDVLLCNAFSPELPGYTPAERFNVFRLPRPRFAGDRRMYNFMHRTWHNANNGGGCVFYQNTGGRFARRDIGLRERRWTLAAGAADLNGDGYQDLYLANDFGPDQLYINERGRGLRAVAGTLAGSAGRDTYKGMNVSIGDVDNNGHHDIYVSNVHERLQAEGSLLWMNDGGLDRVGHRALSDEAAARNALNESRFGWGAAMADLDRDGRLDLLQANGHLDDAYDRRYPSCPDYWYWNDKIALTGPDNHGYADRWADLRGRCIFPREQNRVYLNRGRYFVDFAEQAGFSRRGEYRAIALADFDNRGAADAVVTSMFAPAALYRGEPEGGKWIGFELRGDGARCNADATGTKVIVETPAGRQVREAQSVSGFSAQSDRRLMFGLGAHGGGVRARIEWCGGVVVEEKTLAPGRYHVFRMGEQRK